MNIAPAPAALPIVRPRPQSDVAAQSGASTYDSSKREQQRSAQHEQRSRQSDQLPMHERSAEHNEPPVLQGEVVERVRERLHQAHFDDSSSTIIDGQPLKAHGAVAAYETVAKPAPRSMGRRVSESV